MRSGRQTIFCFEEVTKLTPLEERWENQRLPLSPEDFATDMGSTVINIQRLNFDQLSKLSKVAAILVPAGGGLRFPGSELQESWFKWQVVKADSLAVHGEFFCGRGEDMKSAALSGLVVFWELRYLRRTQ